ncbi:MAG: hypothetical protein ACK5CH_05315, partial [Bacteroidota bacterium]
MKYLLALCLCIIVPGTVLTAQDKLATSFNADLLKAFNVRSIGPGAMSGRITAITVDPFHPEVIYAGAASGGVWRSRSGGTAWEPIFVQAATVWVGCVGFLGF